MLLVSCQKMIFKYSVMKLSFFLPRDCETLCDFAIPVNTRRWNGEGWRFSDLTVGTAVYFGRFAWIGAKTQSIPVIDLKGNFSAS